MKPTGIECPRCHARPHHACRQGGANCAPHPERRSAARRTQLPALRATFALAMTLEAA